MSQSKGAGGAQSNYKVSYLNRPSAVLNSTSSDISSTKLAALAQRANISPSESNNTKITNAAAYGAVINQDSKMSFKDYIDLQNLY